MRNFAAAAGALIAAVAFTAGAQAQNISADPLYGTVNLDGGFLPDPHTVSVEAGGPMHAGPLGNGCNGYITPDQPDVRLNFNAGVLPLYLYVESGTDTTLVVNLPNGTWLCNDDFIGLNPGLSMEPAMSGQYDIWVGTFAPGSIPPATLFISELDPRLAPR